MPTSRSPSSVDSRSTSASSNYSFVRISRSILIDGQSHKSTSKDRCEFSTLKSRMRRDWYFRTIFMPHPRIAGLGRQALRRTSGGYGKLRTASRCSARNKRSKSARKALNPVHRNAAWHGIARHGKANQAEHLSLVSEVLGNHSWQSQQAGWSWGLRLTITRP